MDACRPCSGMRLSDYSVRELEASTPQAPVILERLTGKTTIIHICGGAAGGAPIKLLQGADAIAFVGILCTILRRVDLQYSTHLDYRSGCLAGRSRSPQCACLMQADTLG